MPLRDHQPDILFRGDAARRARHRRFAEADFLTRTIALELQAVARTGDPARRGAGRRWIFEAQRRRRDALAAVRHAAEAQQAGAKSRLPTRLLLL